MTSWVWMKGIDVAIADPIDPVNESDQRPAVKDLITDHREFIDKAKAKIEKDPLYDASKHDDLWILRFVLSHAKKHKNEKKEEKLLNAVVTAAKQTLQFRAQHKLDDDDLRAHPPVKGCRHPKAECVKAYLDICDDDTFSFGIPESKRGVIAVFRMGGIKQHDLVERLDESVWLPVYVYMSEWNHQWLDYITRTTGRLTKNVRMVSCEGITISGLNKENQRRDGKAMAEMEDFYPQLLQCIFVCQPPIWIQIPWRIVRLILPKRVIEKIDFISPKTSVSERKKLLAYISEEHLPARFGGKNEEWPVKLSIPKL